MGGGAQNTTLNFSFTGLTAAPTFSLAWSRDFSIGTPSCTLAATTNCSLVVSFNPLRPGLRQDEVTAKNQAGTVLQRTLLEGVGLGPLIALYPGVITTLTGNGTFGYQDSPTPASVMFRYPQGIALDGSGSLAYVADSVNMRIRKIVLATGAVITVAGNGASGFSGDGGPALNATLNTPTGVAVDGGGNLYIADQANNLIRRVDAATQIITTVAGGGTVASGADGFGDGGPATSAILYGPQSVTVDPAGNLYIADAFHNLVRMVNAASGTITVVAGGGTSAGTDGFGDGGSATSAQLNNPSGVALDSLGNLYVADTDDQLIREVNMTTGIITAVAGNGSAGYNGDNGLATAAELTSPQGVVVDAANNIYIADFGNNAIRQVSAASQKISTLAGRGSTGYYGDGGNPTVAFLTSPTSLAVDENGNLYIADYANNVIRRVSYLPQPMSFASEPEGALSPSQVVSPVNIGNETLSVNALSFTTSFQQVSAGLTDCAVGSALPPGGRCDVGVSFSPLQTGAISGSLEINTNSLNQAANIQAIDLSATGLATAGPKVSLSAASLTFAGQLIGSSSAAQTVTLSNTGGSTFTITSIWLAGSEASDFQISTTCGSSLAAGANCAVSVTFAPTASGTRNATLMFSDLVVGTPQSVTLTGTGNGGVLSLNASSLSINGIAGEPSSQQTITLSNTGADPLHILSIWISGVNASEFHVTTNCGQTVAPAAICLLYVGFTGAAVGSGSATLSISDDAGGSPQTVSLSGTAIKGSLHYHPIWVNGQATFLGKLASGKGHEEPTPAEVPKRAAGSPARKPVRPSAPEQRQGKARNLL